MPSPIYDAMKNARGPQPRSMQLIEQYNSFKQDPFMFMLQNRGINVPEQYRNNPEEAVKYLVNSGQMSQEQLNYITSMAQRMGIRI